MNTLKNFYARIFPKDNGQGYSTGEIVARLIIWSVLFTALFAASFRAYNAFSR
jgi:hypothetical protein